MYLYTIILELVVGRTTRLVKEIETILSIQLFSTSPHQRSPWDETNYCFPSFTTLLLNFQIKTHCCFLNPLLLPYQIIPYFRQQTGKVIKVIVPRLAPSTILCGSKHRSPIPRPVVMARSEERRRPCDLKADQDGYAIKRGQIKQVGEVADEDLLEEKLPRRRASCRSMFRLLQ